MKKKALIKTLRGLAKENGLKMLYLGGTNHEKWRFGDAVLIIPRHSELDEYIAKSAINKARAVAAEASKGATDD
jgi:hypothetical protein